ncbi:hypothetical protein [Leifsonia poae]|uniref:hypothetical protein n=1 Tax=Leifsonia poae TaxID=110933 RepID=UPI003D67AF3C
MKVARRLGIWALDYLYAVRYQVRAVFSRERPDAFITGSGPLAPVVLIPGIFEPWRFLLPLARHVHAAGRPVHVIAALGHNDRSSPREPTPSLPTWSSMICTT